MRPCHNYFLSFHIQNKVFHFTPLTQYIIASLLWTHSSSASALPSPSPSPPEGRSMFQTTEQPARFSYGL